ncbi:MAG: glycosyltransferase family 39 protein [Geobacteraceae bacterium]|nr:glycosyltransferase family 39 protein [Geobacteraceae bacterium]
MTNQAELIAHNRRRWLTCGLILVAAILAFWLRIIPWRNFVDSTGSYLFYGPDSYDHLRRITLGLEEFPRIPMFDSYYGYPVGTGFIWSPFFDYVITCATLLSGGGTGTAHLIGFWVSPVLGGATVAVLYLATARLFGRLPAVVAAFFLAFLPGHIVYTFASELDHHCVEPLLALAVLMSVSSLKTTDGSAAGRIPPWLLAAIFFVAALMLWRGSVIFWGMAVGGVLLQTFVLTRTKSEDTSPLGRQGAFTCLSAALMLVPLCLIFGGSGGSGIKFNIVSWFHVILLLCSAAVIYLLSRRSPHGISLKVTISALVTATILLATIGREFVSGIFSGLAVVGRGDPWLDSISELRSMLFPSGSFDLMHSLETLSLAYWLFPLIFWKIYKSWRESKDLQAAVFLVWSLSLWIMPLFRERYVHLAALPVAMAAGYAARAIHQILANRINRASAVAVSGILLLLFISPASSFLMNLKNVMLPRQEITDLPDALRYLRENTPVTSYYSNPTKTPEYGVLSEWGLGAYICYQAQRPTVATNFGWETHGLYESVSFLTASDPQFALDLLSRNRVRYLLLSDISASLPNFRKIALQEKSPYKVEISKSGFKPLATIYYRLYIQDGSAFKVGDADLPALSGYRLVHETASGNIDPVVGNVSHYKIFEKVPGALIVGAVSPSSRVFLQASFKSSSGRVLTYTDWVDAEKDGQYSFRMPYSTTGNNGDLVPVGSCTISTGTRRFTVDVSESEVMAGSRINQKQ